MKTIKPLESKLIPNELFSILKKDKELKRVEDILYGKSSELAIQEGFASDKEAEDLLNSL